MQDKTCNTLDQIILGQKVLLHTERVQKARKFETGEIVKRLLDKVTKSAQNGWAAPIVFGLKKGEKALFYK